jgi:hypothetical protein
MSFNVMFLFWELIPTHACIICAENLIKGFGKKQGQCKCTFDDT